MKAETLRLQLGCFDRPADGWLNTDITPHLWVARVPGLAALLFRMGKMTHQRWQQHQSGIFRKVYHLNATKPFPYADNTFLAVFSCHVLEHLHADEAQICVGEIFRILKPGAVCRIVVPDLDKIVAGYDPEHPELFLARVFEWSPGAARKNMHCWHYNAESLLGLLRGAGFKDAYRCGYRQGKCPDLAFLDNRPEESLFVEAVK